MRRQRIASLAVAMCAAFTGCNLFIGLSIGSYWLSLDGAKFYSEFWVQFGSFLFTIMPLFLGAFVALLLAMRTDPPRSPERRDWRRALVCYAMVTLITAFWHLPLNLSIGRTALEMNAVSKSELLPLLRLFEPATIAEAQTNRQLWLIGHTFRILLSFAMTLFAIKASIGRSG